MKIAKQWYAVYTKPRCEKKVAELLSSMQVENYCPLNKTVAKWSLRKKFAFEPLFTSYVFVYTTAAEHQAIKQTEGVLNFIFWLGQPAIINEAEINTIKKCLDEYHTLDLEQIDVDIHEAVSINRGPFFGIDGNQREQLNATKFNLPTLGFALVATTEKAYVEVISAAEVFSKRSISLFGYRQAI